MRLVGSRLVCIRGEREVFAGVDLAVRDGEALVINGHNGAGKSSLLRIVAGLLRLAGGTLVLENGDADRSIGEQVHYLGHHDALKPSLTVSENLRFWVRYQGGGGIAPDAALAESGLDTVGHVPAAYLSAGQRRRLSLARLISSKRPIWLLDEPTSLLDAAAQSMLTGMMSRHLSGGGIIIAATHAPIGLAQTTGLTLGAGA